MKQKNTCFFFVIFIICILLCCRSIIREIRFYLPVTSSPETVYNSTISSLENNKQARNILSLNKCHHGNLLYGNFCVISPYTQDRTKYRDATVTLTTQGTYEYLHHVVVLCNRWAGPISVAVYTPPDDYLAARKIVDTLRDCDFCIRHWVSWHFFHYNVPVPAYPNTEIFKECESVTQEQKPRKKRSGGIYPINVGRNIARAATVTPFVFPIDIELYPSSNILPKFERMLQNVDVSGGLHVWVIPVFEVYSKYRAPLTKSELRDRFAKKQAISFHKYRCDICHKIPNLTRWVNQESSLRSEVIENLEPLKIWETVKRSKKFNLQYWEPFFIGTRDDPEFDIRLSWEGRQNKMQLAFEMCLLDYNFHIIENAFLTHSPGINVYNASEEKFRNKYSVQNNKVISIIRKELVKKYGAKKDC